MKWSELSDLITALGVFLGGLAALIKSLKTEKQPPKTRSRPRRKV